jgi:hypothetical protein
MFQSQLVGGVTAHVSPGSGRIPSRVSARHLLSGGTLVEDLWHNYSLVKTAIGEECHGPSKARGVILTVVKAV